MSGAIIDSCPSIPSGAGASALFLNLINTLFSVKCNLDLREQYPLDYAPHLQNDDAFEFIIIGGGTAGSVVANVLSENEAWRVLVLEAGEVPSTTAEIAGLFYGLLQTNEDWQDISQPNNNALLGYADQRTAIPNGKVLGGGSTLSETVYTRGQESDYNEWASAGNTGWDYQSVLPHFIALENMSTPELRDSYGTDGFLKMVADVRVDPLKDAIYAGAEQLGIPVLKEEGPGFFEAVNLVYNGEKQNAGKAFLGSVQNRTNLFVSYGSYVEKIIIDEDTAQGVLVNVQGRRIFINATKEVIVSAGTIRSPQLLSLSGIGPREHLKSLGIESLVDLPVGENFHDHAVFTAFFLKFNNFSSNINILDETYKYLMYRDGLNLARGIHRIYGFINDNTSKSLDFQLVFPIQPQNSLSTTPVKTISDEVNNFKSVINENFTTLNIVVLPFKPKSRGLISLNSSDAYENPVIYTNYLDKEEDVEAFLRGIRFAEELIKTDGFQQLGAELVLIPIRNCNETIGSDDYWRCAVRTLATSSWHYVGTNKMGSVVDSRLRVFGVTGLRVIDGSVIPVIPAAGPMGPILMIGHKGATLIREDYA